MAWAIAGLKINPFKITIRRKLLFISTVLFVVPWIGIKYIQDMEIYLRENQQESLLEKAQVVAAMLQGHADIFKSRASSIVADVSAQNTSVSHLYVRPLKNAIQIDGYIDDGLDYQEKSRIIRSTFPESFEYRYYLASHKKYLYMILKIKDDKVVYRQTGQLTKNDHVIIKIIDKHGLLKTYIIATESPGWVTAKRVEWHDGLWQNIAPELRIKGEWQETVGGYNVELRLPLSLIGDGFSFYVADVDNAKTGTVKSVSGEGKLTDKPGSIIIPSLTVEALLARINRPATRIWIVDKQYRVLAVAGDIRDYTDDVAGDENKINTSMLSRMLNILYYLILKQPVHHFKDELSSASFLRSQVVQSALKGKPATRWRLSSDNRVGILTASYPIVVAGKPIGAIAIEKTSNAILILQNRGMEILINLGLLTFLITVIVLLGFATHLSMRIRRLRNQTERAISSEGRIKNKFNLSYSSDEIGDLSRSFSEMLSRLSEYNRYLETMAGKLSHELRTPVAVARSSIENLKVAQSSEERAVYIQRADEGLGRLSDILTRMSEATRLEQTLQSETLQMVNLEKMIESCMAGYQTIYPNVDFIVEKKTSVIVTVSGVPELLAQMLDKLISNAVDFHKMKTPVVIKLSKIRDKVCLEIINQGKILPLSMRENLFESMVSVRESKSHQSHLGLGLYIVRMIVEFHQGEIFASNLQDESGVVFRLNFPLV